MRSFRCLVIVIVLSLLLVSSPFSLVVFKEVLLVFLRILLRVLAPTNRSTAFFLRFLLSGAIVAVVVVFRVIRADCLLRLWSRFFGIGRIFRSRRPTAFLFPRRLLSTSIRVRRSLMMHLLGSFVG